MIMMSFLRHMVRVCCSRHLTKDNTLQPYNTGKYLTSNDWPEHSRSGYNLYVCYIWCQLDIATRQPKKVKFEFSPPVDVAVALSAYALLLTKELKSIHSHGQRLFGLTFFSIFQFIFFLSLLVLISLALLHHLFQVNHLNDEMVLCQ